jgi:hypothetical protein
MERCTQENKKHLSWKQIILIISILQEIRGVQETKHHSRGSYNLKKV